MMNFNEYLFRCSSLGALMTYPEKDTLSAGPKTALGNIFKEVVFKKTKEIKSKYLEKGKLVEGEAIEMYNQVKQSKFVKNEKRYNNEYITGEPDIVSDIIIDIKSPWDYTTFPFTEESLPSKDKGYYWQLQGYMALTGKESSKVAYCLVDTPDGIIYNDMKSTAGKLGLHVDDLPDELTQEIWDSHKYTGLDMKVRIKEFEVERDQKSIDSIYKRVTLAREYLNTLTQLLT